MLKLKTLITEQEQFKAKSKETGRVVVYKSKDAMDKAIKGGTAEPLDKKTSDKPEKTKGADLFTKDVQKKKTDTNVDASIGKVYGDDGKEITISPKDQKIINKHKTGQITDEELEAAGYSEFRGTYFKEEPEPSKEVPKVSTAKVSKQTVKSVSDLANEIEKNIDDAYEDLDSDKRDDFATTLQNVGTFLEDEIDYDDLSQEDRKEFDEIFGEIEEQVSHLENDELGMGSIEGDPREVSKRATEFINKFSTKNEGIIKLKTILKEGKVWERKFGEPLPTFSSVMEKHSGKKIDEQGVLSRKAGINVFGDKKLELIAKSLINTAKDLHHTAKRKDEKNFDGVLDRITISLGVIRSYLNKPKRSM